MDVLDRTAQMWIVLDDAAEVVVMCCGADATEVVKEWASLGYGTVCVDAGEVHSV